MNTYSVKISGFTIPPSNLTTSYYPVISTNAQAAETIYKYDHTYNISAEHSVKWDWRNRFFDLADGMSVVIEFNTTAVQYNNDCDPRPNTAHALLWGCTFCQPSVYDYDTANVSCCHLIPTLRKPSGMDDSKKWVENITTVVGDTVRFKLALTYYGPNATFNISVVDYLPDCLEYNNAATKTPTAISANLKTIWWNFTEDLSNAEVISIEFNAKVINTTECCEGINTAVITLDPCVGDTERYEDTASITSVSKHTSYTTESHGPTQGRINEVLTFTVVSEDNEGDQVTYLFDWEGFSSLVYYPQGVPQTYTHHGRPLEPTMSAQWP